MTSAIQHLEDLLDLCNGAAEEQCAHATLEHVTRVDGYVEAENTILAGLSDIADAAATGYATPERALEAAGHMVALAVALGYALGADGTAETFQSLEVPANLAGLDFLEPVLGDN